MATMPQEGMRSAPPASVRQAIDAWTDMGGLTKFPVKPGEKSFIFDWGVRVRFTDTLQKKERVGIADEACRTDPNRGNMVILSRGRTSAATKHLRLIYQIRSPKSEKETKVKRKREIKIEHLRASSLYKNDPTRLNLLLETLRIINHNLPLRMGEYEESPDCMLL
ncbi:hypothetical protein V7S43_000907 [Phytophthora oleae]|uniref:Uncharacterized protein n=1 Tax=Phytophthora oleae TaxID=2107226 RepID=A0ABD3G8M9_9STRA